MTKGEVLMRRNKHSECAHLDRLDEQVPPAIVEAREELVERQREDHGCKVHRQHEGACALHDELVKLLQRGVSAGR